jgi:hypothetical protein
MILDEKIVEPESSVCPYRPPGSRKGLKSLTRCRWIGNAERPARWLSVIFGCRWPVRVGIRVAGLYSSCALNGSQPGGQPHQQGRLCEPAPQSWGSIGTRGR